MFDLHLKNRLKHKHMPNAHRAAHMMKHMVHDERFWAVVALIMLMAAIITIVLVIGPTSISQQQPWPVGYPYFP